jgi:uracil-DNA glycosylase family 4
MKTATRSDSVLRNDPNCTLCRLNETTSRVCVLGHGPRRAEVMIIGEAPGANEEKTGELFSGKSGELLEAILEEHGFNRDDIFICNAVSCRPPGNRTPTKGEIKQCKKWLDYQIAMVDPKYVLLLGNTPLMSITGKAGITKRRGRPWEADGRVWLATYHPAFALRDPALRDPDQEAVISRDIKVFSDIVDFGGIPEDREVVYRSVVSKQDVKDMLADLYGSTAFDIETTQLYPWQHMVQDKDTLKWELGKVAKIVSMGFATSRNIWCLPVFHPQSPWTADELQDIVEQIDERMDDLTLITQNGKFDMLWMRVHFGVEWEVEFDTMLAHFLLDENDLHGLKPMAMKFLGVPDWEIGLQDKQGGPWNKHSKYLAHDVFYTRKLRFLLGKLLTKEPDVRRVFNKILMPCMNLFVDVEFNGVYINQEKFDDAEEYLRGEYNGALQRLKEWEPEYILDGKGRKQPFNWGSPQQLGKLLFGDPDDDDDPVPYGLGIEALDKTKGGGDSTSESVLKRIDHPCIADLLKFREAKQQLSFFIDGWKPFLVNGRLHPSFKLAGTVTGRLSCENPNLQQVPRDPRIRTLIGAPVGWSLIEADLSQIELRIAAELANERAMITAFKTGVDVHWLTALREIARGGGLKSLVVTTAEALSKGTKLTYSQSIQILLKMGPDAAQGIAAEWKEYRKKAKAINFGYLYGMWWKKFKLYARDNYGVTVTDEEAQNSRIAFFDLYPDFPEWHNRQRRHARKYGYVTSLSGRKRRLPAARMTGDDPITKAKRQEAERQAINSPVQSFANEINLMAAIQLRKEFPRRVLRIVGTVHDAILMEVRDDWVERVYKRTLEIMSRPDLFDDFDIEMEVPIEAEAKIGPWAAGISLTKWMEKYGKTKEAA